MSGMRNTLQPNYFEAIYLSDPDPWKFASSDYEQEKYAMTLNALPKRHYQSALEVGCSIGVLTRELAFRCDALLAVDAAQTPILTARRRCADLPTVRFEQMFVPERWPAGVFDLILLSEIIYYMDRGDVARLASDTAQSLAPKGDMVLVHWTGATDYPLRGDEAAEIFITLIGTTAGVVRQDRHDFFRLDVLSRR